MSKMKKSHLINLIYFTLLLNTVTNAGNESDTNDLTPWQKKQEDYLHSIFTNWTDGIANDFLQNMESQAKKIPIETCSNTTLGLGVILEKLTQELGKIEAEHWNGRLSNFTAAIQNLEKLKIRTKFLKEESFSENQTACIRKFDREHENVDGRIQYLEAQFKIDIRKNVVKTFMENMIYGRVGPILETAKTMNPSDLKQLINEVMQKMLPSSNEMKSRFAHLLWVLERIGVRAPMLTQVLTEASLIKLKFFQMLPDYFTVQLAAVSWKNRIPMEMVHTFPSQIQILLWGNVSCIQNVRAQKILREEPTFTNLSTVDFLPMTLRSPKKMTVQNCGWVFVPSLSKDKILFKIVRTIVDPNREWRLSSNHGGKFSLSADPRNRNLLWEIKPTPRSGGRPNDIAFTFEPQDDLVYAKSICTGRCSWTNPAWCVSLGYGNSAPCTWTLAPV